MKSNRKFPAFSQGEKVLRYEADEGSFRCSLAEPASAGGRRRYRRATGLGTYFSCCTFTSLYGWWAAAATFNGEFAAGAAMTSWPC